MTLEELLAQRNTQKGNLDELLKGQRAGIDPAIEDRRNKINLGRDRFFSGTVDPAIQSVQGSLGIIPTASPELKALSYSKLGRSLSGSLANRKRSTLTKNLTNSFDVAYQNAINAGLDEKNARDYAYKAQKLAETQKLEASEGQKNRDSSLRKQNVAEQYGQMISGINTGGGGFSPSDIVLAQLLGLGATVGTGMALKNRNQQPQTNTPIAPNSINSQGLSQYGYNNIFGG